MILAPKYPNWDGLTSTRLSRTINEPPSSEDWDQLLAEIIAMQAATAAEKLPITFSITNNNGLVTGLQLTKRIIPYDCTIISAKLLGDAAGSIVVDVLKSAFADYPTTASICASAKPTLSSVISDGALSLTGWTTSLSKGDVLEVNINSVSTFKSITLELGVS